MDKSEINVVSGSPEGAWATVSVQPATIVIFPGKDPSEPEIRADLRESLTMYKRVFAPKPTLWQRVKSFVSS